MEAQQVSSAVQIYKIFSKKGFTEEEAGIIATALEQKDNLVTKDDLSAVKDVLVDRIHKTNIGMVGFGIAILAAIFVTNPRVLDLISKLWGALPK
jgi:hypothetical protein